MKNNKCSKKRSRIVSNQNDDEFTRKIKNKIKLPQNNTNTQLINLKQEIINRYVDLNMIINLTCSFDVKIELLKKYYELENSKCSDDYLDKYMVLWNNYNNIKTYPQHLVECSKQDDEVKLYYSIVQESGLDDKYINYLNSKIYLFATCKSDEETYKLREYLKFVTEFPWTIYNRDVSIPKLKTALPKVMEDMDRIVYGMDKCKTELLRHYLNFMLGNTTDVLAICGPPGVGKTCILRTLAECINTPIQIIQGGCISDINYLTGHSSTYIHAQPGIIAQCIKASGRLDFIVMIDELDKIFDNCNQHSGAIINALIHIFDKSQADRFHDEYIGNIPINIGKIMFVATLNSTEKMSDIIKNRLKIIYLEGYNNKQKIEIASKHIIPKCTRSIIFRSINNPQIIKFDRDVLLYIINNIVEKEHGIRSLERCIKDIINIIQYKIVMSDGLKLTDIMTVQLLIRKILPLSSYL